MRLKIVAGNWKMNTLLNEAVELSEGVAAQLNFAQLGDDSEVVIVPPFTHLYRVGEILANRAGISLGGQNCHQEYSGAYTGEVSAPMLRSLGASWVILGHSERRQYFGEGDKLIATKVESALQAGLRPIYCCGENLAQRDAGEHEAVVGAQIKEALFGLDAEEFGEVVIAYEPIWAIGTGRTASPEQAQSMHAFIRGLVKGKYGASVAENCTILYGGSCKPSNATELFACPDIDGGLIGGAALKVDDFMAIVEALS